MLVLDIIRLVDGLFLATVIVRGLYAFYAINSIMEMRKEKQWFMEKRTIFPQDVRRIDKVFEKNKIVLWISLATDVSVVVVCVAEILVRVGRISDIEIIVMFLLLFFAHHGRCTDDTYSP